MPHRRLYTDYERSSNARVQEQKAKGLLWDGLQVPVILPLPPVIGQLDELLARLIRGLRRDTQEAPLRPSDPEGVSVSRVVAVCDSSSDDSNERLDEADVDALMAQFQDASLMEYVSASSSNLMMSSEGNPSMIISDGSSARAFGSSANRSSSARLPSSASSPSSQHQQQSSTSQQHQHHLHHHRHHPQHHDESHPMMMLFVPQERQGGVRRGQQQQQQLQQPLPPNRCSSDDISGANNSSLAEDEPEFETSAQSPQPQQQQKQQQRTNVNPKPLHAIRDRFRVLEHQVLGKGGYGVVYRAWDQVEGRHLACKQIGLQRGSYTAVRELFQEYQMLTTLSHPNIVKVVGFVAKGGQGRIFMEWMPSGSVQSVMTDTKSSGGLPDSVIRRYLREALQGLEYLHARKIVHRDIKPGNMLLSASGEVKRTTDFGTVNLLDASKSCVETGSIVGTVPYLAPECVRGQYSAASDIWALGCTALHMATNEVPWYDEVTESIGLIFKLGTLTEADHLPKSVLKVRNPRLREWMEAAMTFDRCARPTATALLGHPLFDESS